LAVQAERQRVIGIGHGAIAIDLSRAVDIAEFSRPQRRDRYCDVFGRTDGEPGPHSTEAAPKPSGGKGKIARPAANLPRLAVEIAGPCLARLATEAPGG
jgi:hypothetical protein